jgi:hypothetical protein
MQLGLFQTSTPKQRNPTDVVALRALLTAMWPERSPWVVQSRLIEGRGVDVDPGPPVAFGGRTGVRRWSLQDERMSLPVAIREARWRSMEFIRALAEATGWAWVEGPARPGELFPEVAIVHVHGETSLEATRSTSCQLAVRVRHPAQDTHRAVFPCIRGFLTGLDFDLDRLARLVDRAQPAAREVIADLDVAAKLEVRCA